VSKVSAIAIAVGAVIAGGLLGFGVSEQLLRNRLGAYEMANIDHLSTYVMIQRFQGTPEAYEAALRNFLAALDERERAGAGPFSSVQILAVDRALTYVRLALLAAERSDLNAAARYRSEAEALCPQMGWKSCSAEEMTEAVRRLDERSMWNPNAAPLAGHGS
jgi:hypothetical protein